MFRLNLEQGRFLNSLQTDSVYVYSFCVYSFELPEFNQVFALNWYLWFCISELFIRENNVCDINPVHYLFATGTSEVSVLSVLASVCMFNTVLKPLRMFGDPTVATCSLLQSVTRDNFFSVRKKWSQYRQLYVKLGGFFFHIQEKKQW